MLKAMRNFNFCLIHFNCCGVDYKIIKTLLFFPQGDVNLENEDD